MLKFTVFLCAGLYAAMLFGGVDRGQQRFGLIATPEVTVQPSAVVVAEVEAKPEPAVTLVSAQAFVPEAPLMATPVAAVSTPEPAATPGTTPEGVLMRVSAKSVNVRSGPGKDFEVVERLTRGESVLVVAEGEGVDDWSLIRIEGDGIEGYVASRLLAETTE